METSNATISRLRAARLLAGEPLHAIAVRVGISVPHLSRIERGIRGASLEVTKRLATQLKLPVDHLFEADR
jgi:transcriptional regulator with XRE-family HTH domain